MAKNLKFPLEIWYEDGVHFSCKVGCMRCCGGAPGDVWVTQQDIEAIAAYLNMRASDFEAQYVRGLGERKSLIEKPNYDCIFVADGPPEGYSAQVGTDWDQARLPTTVEMNNHRQDVALRRSPDGGPEQHPIAGRVGHCAIYPVRPMQCRTYPFWKSILDKSTDAVWKLHKDQCPGLDTGKHWTKEEILERRAPSNL